MKVTKRRWMNKVNWYYCQAGVGLELIESSKTVRAKKRLARVISNQLTDALVVPLFRVYEGLPDKVEIRFNDTIRNFTRQVIASMREERMEKLPEKEVIYQEYLSIKSERDELKKENKSLSERLEERDEV